jgi:predicted DsbA family dithiol-disulfide isomerase|tara:strand:+ start:7802 stop:8287 length:486 start_codon:yes stop_codon:yes gene_type:complete
LHPEIPDGGAPNNRQFSSLQPVAEELEVKLVSPNRFYPTRRAHQAALVVEYASPEKAPVYHDRLYASIWEDQRDIEDPEVLAELAADLSVPPGLIERVVSNDELWPAVLSSMERAHEWGATGTPSWVIDNKLLVPGLQDDAFFDRVIERLTAIKMSEQNPE